MYGVVHQRCGQHTVTFSKSASEEVGDRGLMGLREGELPTLETYSGSGTYRTCKHNPCLYLHRRCLVCKHTTHARTGRDKRESLSHICIRTQPNYMFDKTNNINWNKQLAWLRLKVKTICQTAFLKLTI